MNHRMHKTKESIVMFLGITLLTSCISVTLTDLGLSLLFFDASLTMLHIFSFGVSFVSRMALAQIVSSWSRGERITKSTFRNISWSSIIYGIPAVSFVLLFPPLVLGVYLLVWISNATNQNLFLFIILAALIYDYPRLLLALRVRRKKTQLKNTFRDPGPQTQDEDDERLPLPSKTSINKKRW
jgi:hypothetical protein